MVVLCLSLIVVAFVIAWPLTAVVRRVSARIGAHDTAPIAGQVKAAARKVPNTGGVAVFWAVVLPVVAGVVLANVLEAHSADKGGADYQWVPAALREHIGGIQSQTKLAGLLVGSLALLHVLGLIDDRKPLGPWLKLVIMAAPAVAIPVFSDTRLLTLLDAHVGGPWLSIVITALWFLVVTNAMNFMDNMDGLAGGVGVVASACFLAAALMQGQWFVGASLALLIGALLGFLVFNFPARKPATIFMGDGGSLVVGFLLAFLTTRTTYASLPGAGLDGHAGVMEAGRWYGVLMPLIVLAVPLYDFVSVVLIRLSQGKSPFVGDLQHLSHRVNRRGLSKRATVLAICGFTAITGSNGIFLGQMPPTAALFAGVQTVVVLGVIALIEFAATPRTGMG